MSGALPSRPRVAFVLPGLHRVQRGAEAAFESVAQELARRGEFDVTLIGSGPPRDDRDYRFLHAPCRQRERFERWPRLPILRSDTVYEEATFTLGLLRVYRPADYDLTVTCSYPFCNWLLRARTASARRPAHVFVTQNGDWAPQRRSAEYRWFSCDGLVTINPEFHERHRQNWFTALIPNGVDPAVFDSPDRQESGSAARRAEFGLPAERPVVLIVAALIPSKRVLEALECVAALPNAHLAVAGDGPQRAALQALADQRMPGRFSRLTLPRERMPALYRCADALLHLSMDESFGNIYVEALASGLPVIAHDRPTTRWILGDQALLVDSHDLNAVRAALRAALDGRAPGDPASRRARALRRFSWSIIAGQYGEFFQHVLQRSTPNV